MTPQMLKLKVAEISQGRVNPFKNGIFGDSWLYWFKKRHPYLVMRVPQGFARAKALNPIIVQRSYSNMLKIYNTYAYTPSHIWNVDESRCNASKRWIRKGFSKERHKTCACSNSQ